MRLLVTGSAGFIGFHVAKELIMEGHQVFGIDNFNDYYDVNLKLRRNNFLLELSEKYKSNFVSIKNDICSFEALNKIFKEYEIEIIVHMAAQAGVRYSINNASKFIQSNIVGFGNILELSKIYNIKHLIYASSSSVYGGNKKIPFNENDNVDHPVSLYAATKKSNELMAHSYSHLFNVPTTGLRFFTVYGPWGRPDMALFLFTKNIIEGKEISVFNNGNMARDFTYIDDIVKSIKKLIFKIPSKNDRFDLLNPQPSESWAPYKIFNIGNSNKVNLIDYIQAIEKNLGMKAIKKFLPMQPGDVPVTYSNCERLNKLIEYRPNTTIDDGISNFIKWYKSFYSI